jgi:hypothetical protein
MNALNVLKRRKTAVIVLILSVLVFTPVGVRKSFAREAGKIEDMFYHGVRVADGDYMAPALYDQIKECQVSALGLLTISSGYSDGGELDKLARGLRAAREASVAADFNTRSGPVKKQITYRYDVYITMYGYTLEMYRALTEAGMDARDRVAADDYIQSANSSFTLAMTQAAALSEKSDNLQALTRAFPIWYIGGRGSWLNKVSHVATPTDGYSVERDSRHFLLQDGKLTTEKGETA